MSAVARERNGVIRRLMLVAALVLTASNGSANGGWVIERDDRGESPLLKERKSIAMTPEQQEQQALAAAYQQALQTEQERIREHWSAPEVSSPQRWVSYADDYSSKRVVDFERNQIEVSVDSIYQGSRLDFSAMSKEVVGELEQVLGTTIAQAVHQDPIQQAINAAYSSLGQAPKPSDAGSELVLNEMFASPRPSETDIRNAAAALMRKSSIRYQALNASLDLASVAVNTGKKLTYVMPLPDNRIRKKVVEYRPEVSRNAQRFSLSTDVMMAIIHTESHFNPLARSHIPAFGLMQIVPSTAGRDATRKLYNKSSLLSAQYLYNPKKNIEVGAAYLSVLYYGYLSEIKNPESRLYYTIAAYNAGASSVARAFVGKASFQAAVETINNMTPEQVLERLITKAPRKETRLYVEKVLKRRAYYATL
ncbi:MAG: transglycosylase SLT domain-containing protein [Pseudomonadota bacterium]|nr:transglycosylase SLT domain-containing protein [Pseudomonadota bacterium]